MCLKKKILGDVMKDVDKELNANNWAVCFTGHRPQKLPWGFNEKDERCQKMRIKAIIEIEDAVQKGYHTFYCGMALGFDMICAEIVLELKKKYPHIKLIGALPCRNQTERWTDQKQIDRYNYLITQLDDIRCIYDIYEDGCLLERNRFMINNSSLVIALFNGLSGGTKSTIGYAKKQGKEIIIIRP